MLKQIGSWIAFGLIVFCAKFAWNVLQVTTTDESALLAEDSALETEWIAEHDRWVADRVAEGQVEPARGWLDDPQHGTFEAHPDQMRDAIERFHEAGAERIWIVEPEAFAGAMLADGFSVELPEPGPERDALFAVEAGLMGGQGSRDVGQQFLSVGFD